MCAGSNFQLAVLAAARSTNVEKRVQLLATNPRLGMLSRFGRENSGAKLNKGIKTVVDARTRIRVVRRAPLGDPCVYALRGYRLCLRRADARHVLVRVQATPPATDAGSARSE